MNQKIRLMMYASINPSARIYAMPSSPSTPLRGFAVRRAHVLCLFPDGQNVPMPLQSVKQWQGHVMRDGAQAGCAPCPVSISGLGDGRLIRDERADRERCCTEEIRIASERGVLHGHLAAHVDERMLRDR